MSTSAATIEEVRRKLANKVFRLGEILIMLSEVFRRGPDGRYFRNHSREVASVYRPIEHPYYYRRASVRKCDDLQWPCPQQGSCLRRAGENRQLDRISGT